MPLKRCSLAILDTPQGHANLALNPRHEGRLQVKSLAITDVVAGMTRGGRSKRAFLVVASVSLTAFSGCAHQAHQEKVATQAQQVEVLQARLEEAERTNGRLTVRIEELEDAVFLLQDRVDANRIALQRNGIMGRQATGNTYAARPAPTPQTNWNGGNVYAPKREQTPVTRIPLGGEAAGSYDDDPIPAPEPREQVPTSQVTTAAPSPQPTADGELVIGEAEFREFEKSVGGAPRPRSGSTSGTSSTKAAQPDVTDEKLPTTAQLGGDDEKPTEAPKRAKSALGTYKDALADYRAGNYQNALGGFEAFLASKPSADYVDNALYWIGECHFGLGKFDAAVSYFQRVMAEQPDGNKVPDAMLKMSIAYDRTGKGADATRLLEDLTRQYPSTNAGKLASQKLAERPQ